MKSDIQSINEIRQVVDTFYDKAIIDEQIGHFFTQVMKIQLTEHLPIIYSFWDSVLFGTASYKGNVMLKHLELNRISPISDQHLDRWLHLWTITTQELYTGVKTEEMLQRARDIKALMSQKINRSGDPRNIQ